MKKYFYLLAMLAVVLGTTACSDDDNHPVQTFWINRKLLFLM